MNILSKSGLESFTKAKKIDIDGNTAVYIRKWTLKERLEYFDTIANAKEDAKWYETLVNITIWVVAKSLCNADGSRMYSDGELSKIEDLDGTLLDIVYEESMVYNGLKDGAIKAEIKNSETIQSADSQ
jgi:hypothetical protein